MNIFNEYLSSLVKQKLVDTSEIVASNSAYFFKIVFPGIPELNGVELAVRFSNKEWPHYTYAEIFRCINAQYPAITSPTFLGQPLHLQINVEGQDVEGLGPKEQTKDLPNGATVELRYHRSLRVPVPNIEGVYGAGAAADAGAGAGAAARPNQLEEPEDNWRDGLWDEEWGDDDLVDPRDAMAAPAPPAPVDPFPPILHPRSRTMMTYDHKSGRYVEPILDGVSGEWMVYDPKYGWYSRPTPPWSGWAMTPGTSMQGPPPMIYPGSGGKKPQSKRGKKKSKSKSKTKKSKTKKSKSKSKRNKRRSYKRVN